MDGSEADVDARIRTSVHDDSLLVFLRETDVGRQFETDIILMFSYLCGDIHFCFIEER